MKDLSQYLLKIEKLNLPPHEKFTLQVEVVYAHALKYRPEEVEETLRGLQGSTPQSSAIATMVKARFDELGIANVDALDYVAQRIERHFLKLAAAPRGDPRGAREM